MYELKLNVKEWNNDSFLISHTKSVLMQMEILMYYFPSTYFLHPWLSIRANGFIKTFLKTEILQRVHKISHNFHFSIIKCKFLATVFRVIRALKVFQHALRFNSLRCELYIRKLIKNIFWIPPLSTWFYYTIREYSDMWCYKVF